MMANLPDDFEDLTPNQARYRLAETKLRLLNALAKLEMMERDLARKSGERRPNETPHFNINLPEIQSTGSSNSSPAAQ